MAVFRRKPGKPAVFQRSLLAAIMRYWYGSPTSVGLVGRGVARVAAAGARHRRRHWLNKRASIYQAPVPVIVVGNLTVGGSGKTPLVVALVEALGKRGFRPGVVLRGYRGKIGRGQALSVGVDSDPALVGDEAVLIARRAGCPVAVSADRPRAVRELLQQPAIDLVISDDGLQHYALGREVEIAVLSGSRGLGNACCLPVGPLREPPERLQSVDFVVINGSGTGDGVPMRMEMDTLCQPVGHSGPVLKLGTLSGQRLHAVAGIGEPERYFSSLRSVGLDIVQHAFRDHYAYRRNDLAFADSGLVLTTEKDAVKLARFADARIYSVGVRAVLPGSFFDAVQARL